MPASTARQDLLRQLQIKMPSIDWYAGRLTQYMQHRTRKIGAISTATETQAPNDQYITRQIIVQAYLPFQGVTKPENVTLQSLIDPSEAEDLAQEVVTALQAIAANGTDYWFIRLSHIEYPSDLNGQQTRAELYFDCMDRSSWQ